MGNSIRILTESELRTAIHLDRDMIDIIERAFAALESGNVVMPPILSMEFEEANGEVDIKTAYIPGFDGFAIKVSPGFFDNPKIGLPSLNGLMMLFSAKTGLVEAVFLDNGYLTDVRTAAAGGVAARHLAPKTVQTACVFGTGLQVRLQMQAAFIERPFGEALVWGRDMDKAEACARDIGDALGIPARAVDDPEAMLAQAQLAITTTPARSPILAAEWLHKGLHITAMGSDQEGKNEIDPRALIAADLYVADRVSQTELLGELRSAIASGLWGARRPAELGAVVAGKIGRKSEDDITICDLTGTGAQDTAIANYALRATKGAGTVIES